MKMTQIFIEEYKSSGGGKGCSQCNEPAQKSMCDRHLRDARVRFQQWTVERVAHSLCVKCHNKSHKVVLATGVKRQGVYCRGHREENRVNCLGWARAHRTEIRAQYKARRAAGVCAMNPSHGKAFGGHIHCLQCYVRTRTNRQLARQLRA